MTAKNRKEHLLNSVPVIMASDNEELILETISLLDKLYAVKIVATTSKLSEINELKKTYEAEVLLLDSNLLDSEPNLVWSPLTAAGLKVVMMADATPTAFQRCLQFMSDGAVDLVLKDQISKGIDHHSYRTQLVNRLAGAAKLEVQLPTALPVSGKEHIFAAKTEILFCEDCGARNVFSNPDGGPLYCQTCGDLLENHLITPYKRTSHVTILVAGTGSYRNLINIIPHISTAFTGTIIAVVSGSIGHVDSLSRYLASISQLPVKRISNGCEIEGGACYIAARDENYIMKPFSTSNRMERAKPSPPNTSFDIMMQSVSESFKHKSAALFLSGDTEEGEHGINFMKKNGGKSAILSFSHCINPRLSEYALRKCQIDKIVREEDVPQYLKGLLTE